jgi:hypothetical protein
MEKLIDKNMEKLKKDLLKLESKIPESTKDDLNVVSSEIQVNTDSG